MGVVLTVFSLASVMVCMAGTLGLRRALFGPKSQELKVLGFPCDFGHR